jgi:hypothetical protein
VQKNRSRISHTWAPLRQVSLDQAMHYVPLVYVNAVECDGATMWAGKVSSDLAMFYKGSL